MAILEEKHTAALANQGWFAQENFLTASLCHDLLADLQAVQSQGLLQRAAVGRGDSRMLAADIRTDETLWLTGDSLPQKNFLTLMNDLRGVLNQALFLGLASYEAHYALYQPGGFYKKHLDSFRGKKNRIVSTVIYLTPDWIESDQGHLVLYNRDDTREEARVLPRAGTLACFISEDIPHEVLPPVRARASIAGWFRAASNDIISP